METINESLLLQPISFQLAVQRNLSADWYTGCPDVDVSGRLESIHVSQRNKRFKLCCNIKHENKIAR